MSQPAGRNTVLRTSVTASMFTRKPNRNRQNAQIFPLRPGAMYEA
jgi:hypothetical protein